MTTGGHRGTAPTKIRTSYSLFLASHLIMLRQFCAKTFNRRAPSTEVEGFRGHPLIDSFGAASRELAASWTVCKHQDHWARRTLTTGNPRYLPVDIERTHKVCLAFKSAAAGVPTTVQDFFLIPHCGQVCEVYFSQTTLTFMPSSAALYSIIALSLSYGQACRR